MASLTLTARLKTAEEFISRWESEPHDGLWQEALSHGLRNTDAEARYKIGRYLLNEENSIEQEHEGTSLLLYVLSAVEQDGSSQTCALVQSLVQAGADINKQGDNGNTPSHALVNIGLPNSELEDLFNYWLSLPDIDFDIKNVFGFTAIDLARKIPSRSFLVARMTKALG